MSQITMKAERWARVWPVPGHGKAATERHLAVLALGLVQALRQKRIDAHEAWKGGLNFKTYMQLKELRADGRLLELWTWAMELPQVEKLGDEALAQSYDAIERLAESVLTARPKRKARIVRRVK